MPRGACPWPRQYPQWRPVGVPKQAGKCQRRAATATTAAAIPPPTQEKVAPVDVAPSRRPAGHPGADRRPPRRRTRPAAGRASRPGAYVCRIVCRYTRADQVGRAAHGQDSTTAHSDGTSAGGRDRQAPADDRDDQRHALPADPADPARRQPAEHRADRDRRVQPADATPPPNRWRRPPGTAPAASRSTIATMSTANDSSSTGGRRGTAARRMSRSPAGGRSPPSARRRQRRQPQRRPQRDGEQRPRRRRTRSAKSADGDDQAGGQRAERPSPTLVAV